MPNSRAKALTLSAVARFPPSPLKQLALPLLARMAHWVLFLMARIDQSTGQALAVLLVKVPAATAARVETISAKSSGFSKPAAYIHVLHGLTAGAFDQIVNGRNDNHAARTFVRRDSDIAKIGVLHVMQRRE